MMDSLFKKMLAIALMISLGSLLCSSFVIGFLLEKQIYNRTKETLVMNAAELNKEVKLFLNGELDKEDLKQTILLLEEKYQIQVSIITDKHDSFIASKDKNIQKWVVEMIQQDFKSAEASFYTSKEAQLFIVGVPILIKEENRGAILLYTPMKEAESLIKDINQSIALSILLLLLPIALISYYISKRVSTPIVSMSDTVRSISQGNFEKKVYLKGRDEFVKLSEAINTMADRLAATDQSRKRFIGEISHELRTPLTTIRSTLQGIADEILSPEEETELINLSIDEIKRISQLIDDLTDLSALEEKAVILYKENGSLDQLLETCITQMSLQAKQKGITLVKHIKPDVYLKMDMDRMKQVLINLLDNAIKHCYDHTPIEISLTKSAESIILKVENLGDPISAEELSLLFDRFYKTDQSRSQKGNGLGLTITKKIVDLHGGNIYAASQNGSICFTVKLPVIEN
jgi:signal transduction histidine kinase